MNFLPEAIEQYAEQHTKPESEVLAELNRETWSKLYMPQMLSGHLQGQFLKMISELIKPKLILEIGTFTGYSSICMSYGLQRGGMIYTIDINEELKEMASRYFEKAGLVNQIKFLVGNALNIIPTLDLTFDMVFIDADKNNYPKYYDLVFDKLNTGGVILADNVLWSGKVLEKDQDEDTRGLVAFNNKVLGDERVENILLPIRDGLMMVRKK